MGTLVGVVMFLPGDRSSRRVGSVMTWGLFNFYSILVMFTLIGDCHFSGFGVGGWFEGSVTCLIFILETLRSFLRVCGGGGGRGCSGS